MRLGFTLPLTLAALGGALAASPTNAAGSALAFNASAAIMPGSGADVWLGLYDNAASYGPAHTAASITLAGSNLVIGPTVTPGYTFLYENSLSLGTQYDVLATLKVDSESSLDPADKSGVGVAITDSQNRYYDLFVGDDEIFLDTLNAEGTERVQYASAPVANTSASNTYELQANGDILNVLVNGSTVLTEDINDLDGATEPTLPDVVTIGDISASASSQFELSELTVQTVPEPTSAFAAVPLAAVFLLRRRRWAA
jgi:hypothetical protein